MRRRKNPSTWVWVGGAVALAGVVGAVIYAKSTPTTPTKPIGPAPKPSPGIGPLPGGGPPAPKPVVLTADGHDTISVVHLADEVNWDLLDRDMLGGGQSLNGVPFPSAPFPGSFLVTDAPGLDSNDIAFKGYGGEWLQQMLATGHQVFVAPNFATTSPSYSRFVALDKAPADYLQVVV